MYARWTLGRAVEADVDAIVALWTPLEPLPFVNRLLAQLTNQVVYQALRANVDCDAATLAAMRQAYAAVQSAATPNVAAIADTLAWALIECGEIDEGLELSVSLVTDDLARPDRLRHRGPRHRQRPRGPVRRGRPTPARGRVTRSASADLLAQVFSVERVEHLVIDKDVVLGMALDETLDERTYRDDIEAALGRPSSAASMSWVPMPRPPYASSISVCTRRSRPPRMLYCTKPASAPSSKIS